MQFTPSATRSLASSLAEPRICGTPNCVGIPESAQFWCPYCLTLASEYDRREAMVLAGSADRAPAAHDLFDRIPGRIDVDAVAQPAPGDGLLFRDNGLRFSPVQLSAFGLLVIGGIALATFSWECGAIAILGLAAGWKFRALAAACPRGRWRRVVFPGLSTRPHHPQCRPQPLRPRPPMATITPISRPAFPHRTCATDEQLRELQERFQGLAAASEARIYRGFCAAAADALRELCDRRREDVTTRGIERSMAFDFASGLLDGETLCVERDGEPDFDWMDLASARDDETGELAEHVEEAIRYLDSRELIERDPEHPDWISIRDESEASDLRAIQAPVLPAVPAEVPR
ncbi:MAG: hypothetical protein M3O02_00900 [Acidobacteriota bacterium]|nr:hypothetical protein [Acidobacteriota bacterium]